MHPPRQPGGIRRSPQARLAGVVRGRRLALASAGCSARARCMSATTTRGRAAPSCEERAPPRPAPCAVSRPRSVAHAWREMSAIGCTPLPKNLFHDSRFDFCVCSLYVLMQCIGKSGRLDASSRCNVMQSDAGGGSKKPRTTATLTAEQGRILRAMAERQKVSVAWLIRHAVDRLIEEESKGLQLPLDMRQSTDRR